MKGIKYLLDTDTLSFLVSGRYPEVRKHATLHKDALSISSVTVAEALYGARRKSSAKLESLIGLFCEMFAVVDWTPSAASAYADIRVALERQGAPIGEMDMMIAASAISGGYTLVTNNTRHFARIDGLALDNWVDRRKKTS